MDNFEGKANTQDQLILDVTRDKLTGVLDVFGPEGIGSFLVPKVLNGAQIDDVKSEILDATRVEWRDNHDSFVNQRKITVIENHMTSALKLHKGDRSYIERVPKMLNLAVQIQGLIRSLSEVFPSLGAWTADEMSLHRYDNSEVGLSFHKDNLRFIGLIAVLSVEGSNDFVIKDVEGNEHTIPNEEGDLTLTRATGLYPAFDEKGRVVNLCPEHAVMNLRTPYKTSFIVRANNRPDEQIPGFSYANWRPDAKYIR